MFEGSIVALVTPMFADGSLALDALRELVEWHIDQGTDAIVAAGTTGESATLDFGEHCKVIERVVHYADKRIPVIAGTGANATREAIALTGYAAQAGAVAALLVTPYYNKPTQEGLYQHYRAIAEAVALPQILYNVPGRTACDMLPETVARLADIDNIIGIKDASSLARIQELIGCCGKRLAIYSGEDKHALETMLAGGQGVISVTANVAPKAMHAMSVAALKGDRKTALAINQGLELLHRDLFAESNPIPVKWVLNELGLIPPGIRLPLTPLSSQYHTRLRQAMRQAELC